VAWTAPSAGEIPVASYSIAIAPATGPAITTSVPGSQLGATIAGLSNGTTYSVTVTAISSFGAGQASSAVSLTPVAQLPAAPSITTSSVADGSAQLTWSTPAAGDAAILFYRLVTTVGSTSTVALYDASTNSATLNGLTNGATYSVTVTAVSGLGSGEASSSVSLVPRTGPNSPRSPKATAGKKKIILVKPV
jgi:predicted RNA-binding protein with TRAM domain